MLICFIFLAVRTYFSLPPRFATPVFKRRQIPMGGSPWWQDPLHPPLKNNPIADENLSFLLSAIAGREEKKAVCLCFAHCHLLSLVESFFLFLLVFIDRVCGFRSSVCVQSNSLFKIVTLISILGIRRLCPIKGQRVAPSFIKESENGMFLSFSFTFPLLFTFSCIPAFKFTLISSIVTMPWQRNRPLRRTTIQTPRRLLLHSLNRSHSVAMPIPPWASRCYMIPLLWISTLGILSLHLLFSTMLATSWMITISRRRPWIRCHR